MSLWKKSEIIGWIIDLNIKLHNVRFLGENFCKLGRGQRILKTKKANFMREKETWRIGLLQNYRLLLFERHIKKIIR